MNMPKKWTEEEEEKLKKHYPTKPLSELMELFDRSGDSVDKKAYKLGLKKAPEYDSSTGKMLTLEELILNRLKTEDFPVDREYIEENIGVPITERKMIRAVERLNDDGYDIDTLFRGQDKFYFLVRTAGYDPEAFYRYKGEIETPVAQTGDWHIANKLHSRSAFEELCDCLEENSVATLMICGDMFQGLGVYTREAGDLQPGMHILERQVDEGEMYLDEIPDCVTNIGIVIGNHESVAKQKYKLGYDMCKAVAKTDPRATYYGYVAKVLLDGEWDYVMTHTEGGVGYAATYKGQRYRDNMIERPHILHIGHIHQPYVHPRPHSSNASVTVTSPTLKREGAYETMRGWTSIIGWYIMDSWSPTYSRFDLYTPRVF